MIVMHRLAAGFIGLCCAATVAAQTFPSRPIRVVVPYAPGGFTDIVARLVGQKMTERLGQAVTIDNRPGGSTIIGADMVAKSAPDGYTLLMGVTTTISTNPFMFKKLPYKASDFAPVALTGMTPFVMVANPALPANNVRELVALAKAKPGSVSSATLGIGSSVHLVLAMLRGAAGIDIIDVPYKGAGPALTDLLAGQVNVYFDAVPTSMPHIRSGKLKAIAMTSDARLPVAPEIPTFKESGYPSMVAYSWYGLLAPVGTPHAVIERLNAAANDGLRSPDVRERLIADSGVAPIMTPEQFGDLIRAHTDVWGKIIAPLKIELD